MIVAKSLEQSLTDEFQMPIVTWGLRRNISLRHLLGYNTLVYVSISSVFPSEEPIFNVLMDGLAGQHYVPMLFIYKRLENRPPTTNELKIFFSWCWRNSFTNVVLTFRYMIFTDIPGFVSIKWHNELFTYTPFPELTLLNLNETGYQKMNILMDLRGYEFRVPIFQDPPLAFQLPNGHISGVLGLMFHAYVRHRRGRIRLEPLTDVDRYNYPEHLMLTAARGEIEMGVHPYAPPIQPGSSLTAGSFPLAPTRTCVLVPWQRKSPSAQFMSRTIFINGSFFLILLLASTLAWQLVRADGRQGIQLILVVFFQQPLPGREFQRLADSYKFIHMAVILASFVLWSLRTGNLSSVFTSQMPGSQIETAKDFLETPLRLMLTETEMQMYFTEGRLPSVLKPRLLVVNRTTLKEHLDRLNTSYAYCSTTQHWTVVKLQQRRMHRPLFRLATKLCTSYQMLRFPIQWNSPFERNLYKFNVQSRQFGFWNHWITRGHQDAIRTGLVVQLTDEYQPFISLTLKDFESLIMLCSLSLLGSFVCLLGEMFWS
ncbi:uncharacterized protein LOC110181740 [Drosophila serrata]|uniref:uncharacterized protein LOC110181740 n=1 Tax=Drosophila serrata TaxID=7274 RepID=UPI000A1D30E6|nr:uncharacterized protein LOC110181740 [Drosophila serrata]